MWNIIFDEFIYLYFPSRSDKKSFEHSREFKN